MPPSEAFGGVWKFTEESLGSRFNWERAKYLRDRMLFGFARSSEDRNAQSIGRETVSLMFST
jgi:hypothetical protein